MPYIPEYRREDLDPDGNVFHPHTAGELNFVFFKICKRYYEENGGYQAINDIVGALEGCKLEFTRRITNGYEDLKIKENGDI